MLMTALRTDSYTGINAKLLLFALGGGRVRSTVMSIYLSVCLSVCLFACITQNNAQPNFTKFVVQVACGRGSLVLL